jgi:hypothetical protein
LKEIKPYIEGLHVLPWFTDGAIDFLDSHIFWLKQAMGKNPNVFEFGAGNSTLYFLSRGCNVTSVEHDEEWAEKIEKVSDFFDYQERLKMFCRPRPYNESIKGGNKDFDLIIVDGRDRVSCLESVIAEEKKKDDGKAILILDNTERVSNKYKSYVGLLTEYKMIHFEQPFVFGSIVTESEQKNGLILEHDMATNGLSAGIHRDRSGNSNKGRSITTVAIHRSVGEFTDQGVPWICG